MVGAAPGVRWHPVQQGAVEPPLKRAAVLTALPAPWTPVPSPAPRPGEAQVVVLPPADGTAVVVLRGEVDIALAPELASVRARLDAQHLRAVVDASRVSFLDAGGWDAVRSLSPTGAPALRGTSPAVRRLLALVAEVDEADEVDEAAREQPGRA